MPRIKNMTFPICARRKESSDEHLVGYESLEHLSFMSQLSKEEQYLFFYNFKNQKCIRQYSGRRIPYYVKSKERAPQTTLVIDFDNLVPSVVEKIKESFLRLDAFLDGKALMVESPSGGRHILYVVRGAAPQEEYARIQSAVIDGFFKEVKMFIDKGATMSLSRGFYHSQHLSDWVQRGLINCTPSLQRKHGFFWRNSREIKFEELYRLLDFCVPVHERKVHELVSDGLRMLDFLVHISRGEDESKKEEYSEKIARILAILQQRDSRESKAGAEKICRRAQEEKYQTAFERIKSSASERVRGSEEIPLIHHHLVQGDNTGRERVDTERDQALERKTRGTSVSGDHPTGDGYGHRSVGGTDGDHGRRLHDRFGDEHILGALSSVRDGLEARNFSSKKLGHYIFQNPLRGDRDRHNVSEESNLGVFVSVLREIVDGDSRIPRSAKSSPEGLFLWFRYASRYLGSREQSAKSLSKFASETARCVRLHLKTQNIEVNLTGEEFERKITVNLQESQRLLEFIERCLPRNIAELTKQNRQSVLKMFREDREWLLEGAAALLTRLKSLYPFIKKEQPVAIGMEDFQEFFQTHTRKATALRHVFMSALSVQTSEYVPCVRRRCFLIDQCIIGEILDAEAETPSCPGDLIVRLGNGQTWQTICRFVKPMYLTYGISKTRSIWYTALDLSSANDPERRKQDVDSFLTRLENQKGRECSYSQKTEESR